jgi:hypothetical protein
MNALATQSLQSPVEYLAGHELTQELRRQGVTDQQLEAIRFWSNNVGWPFEQWSFTWANGTPETAIPLMKAYCALKWLILNDPPGSRDKDDAWRLVGETLIAPIYKSGLEYRHAQSQRARRPRGRLTDDGKTMPEVVRQLALKPGILRGSGFQSNLEGRRIAQSKTSGSKQANIQGVHFVSRRPRSVTTSLRLGNFFGRI